MVHESKKSSPYPGPLERPALRALGYGRGRSLWLAAFCMAGSIGSGWSQECVLPEPKVEDKPGDWCEWLQSAPGTLYKNDDNPWIQQVKFFNRFHFNYAWVDGKSGGQDFWYSNNGEIRRFWPGVQFKLADNALTAHYETIIGPDGKPFTSAHAPLYGPGQRPPNGDRSLDYLANWALYLEWNLNKTFAKLGGGDWSIGYGKRCLPLGEEILDSSKFMPVVERSALSNRLFVLTDAGSSPVGIFMKHKAGPWSSYAGFYSTDTARMWGSWGEGHAWIVQTQRDIKDWTCTDSALLAAAFYYEDTKLGDDRFIGDPMNWAASAWTIIEEGPWTFRANLVLAESDPKTTNSTLRSARDGLFWGFVGTAQYWLIEDCLEAVGRYQYQGSENAQGVRLFGRYARAAGLRSNEDIPGLASGYGDEHHAIYLGLNWLACSHNLKFMSGIEWESMTSKSADVYDGFTFWLGFRHYL